LGGGLQHLRISDWIRAPGREQLNLPFVDQIRRAGAVHAIRNDRTILRLTGNTTPREIFRRWSILESSLPRVSRRTARPDRWISDRRQCAVPEYGGTAIPAHR